MKQLQKLVWIWTVRDLTDILPFEEQIRDAISLSKGVLDVRIYVTKAPLVQVLLLTAPQGNATIMAGSVSVIQTEICLFAVN